MRLSVADAVRGENNFNLIRLAAATGVIFGHAWPLLGTDPDPTRRFFTPVDHYIGTASVYVFFIISGFLLAASIEREGTAAAFVWRRMLRIFPALVVCNAITVLACWAIYNGFSPGFLGQTQVLRYFFLNCLMWFPTAGDFAANDWLPNSFTNVRIGFANGSLWTLVAELKAYVYMAGLYALCLGFFGKVMRGKAWLLWAGMLGAALFSWADLPLVGREPLFRDFFMAFFGGALAHTLRRWIVLNGYLALALAAMLWATKAWAPAQFFYAAALAYPYLVFYAAYRLPYWRRANEAGDFSYGVYLYGWFSQNLVASLVPGMTPPGNFAAGLALSLAFAVPSWFLVEKPALALKSFRFRPLLPGVSRAAVEA